MHNTSVAHIAEDGRKHSLMEHLEGTAKLASGFANEFGAKEWGRLGGVWHDLGKYSPDFQRRIRGATNQVDHSTAGAIHAINKFDKFGRIAAYLIAGHHAGLPDWQTEGSGLKGLAQRTSQTKLLDDALKGSPPKELLNQILPEEKPKSDPALWIRMLFSCLVDADFLDTEAFFDDKKTASRKGHQQINELLASFDSFMKKKLSESDDGNVNRLRAEILKQCREKASHAPSVFTLSVPTGGGKTLSSMAFALNHAVKFNKKRIIYVIPYTSIIEQTADQFRTIFGEAVVEHHSNLDYEVNNDEYDKRSLACENWDAPIIVTTSVQFFESLFASRTSRCRKLHNIVNSVVVIDETQLLPPDFLNPIIKTINELKNHYGVSFILSTATQPALSPHKTMDWKFEGIPETVEIIDDPKHLQREFKRACVELPSDLNAPTSWEELSDELRKHESVLCIVNRRDDCHKLYSLMPEGTIHLSALMCGAHRSKVIDEIKARLKAKVPTRVISTQLVEAGVDIDFPVVYRAMAGLDSIAQAAGRCNREGKLKEGRLVVFVPPSKPPVGHLSQTAEIGKRILANRHEDPLALELFEQFFKELYWLKGDKLDKHGIMRDLAYDRELRISFRTAAEKFHFIDERGQCTVVVQYGEGEKLIEKLEKFGAERWLMRKLQRYVVNLPIYICKKMLEAGTVKEAFPDIYVQVFKNVYDPNIGLCPDKSAVYNPSELVDY